MDRDEEFREFALGQSAGLRRLAYAVGGDWHRADDLVQATLERAYVQWSRVRGAEDPGAYVRTILVHLSASEGRRSWRRREQSRDVVPEPAGRGDESDRVAQSFDLARALTGLTTRQRAIVVLRFVEDRSVHEVSAILGIADGTVKRQTHDAVRRLRELMPDNDKPPQEVPHG